MNYHLLSRTGQILLTVTCGLFLVISPAAAAKQKSSLQLRVTGVTDELEENVTTALVLPPLLARSGRIEPRWLQRFVQQVPALVSEALKPYGYYHAQTTTSTETFNDSGKTRLNVAIVPGEPVRIRTLTITIAGPGADEPALQELREFRPLQEGEILRQDYYETAKGALLSRCIDLGYLRAAFTRHQILLDLANNRAEIDLALDTGPLFRFGAVTISGAPSYPEHFLRRYLAFKPGRPFSYARTGQTQLNFLNSDRFRTVTVTPLTSEKETNPIPVDIILEPTARRKLRPGVGFGTDTGPRFTLQYRDLNVQQRGHELTTELMIAGQRQQLTASYVLPGLHNINNQTTLHLGAERKQLDTYENRIYSTEIERQKIFLNGNQGSLFLRLTQEEAALEGKRTSRARMLIPGFRWLRRELNDELRPSSGYQYHLEVRGAHEKVVSDTTLLQTIASASAVQRLPWSFQLIGRVKGAATLQNGTIDDIPVSLRFFTGGDRSVRGYAYQSLGPTDASGQVIGGRHLLIGSLELERNINEDWALAIFFDTGNAFNQLADFERYDGAGLGVRRYTPVGPIKLDLARTVGQPKVSYRLHFSIGFGW